MLKTGKREIERYGERKKQEQEERKRRNVREYCEG